MMLLAATLAGANENAAPMSAADAYARPQPVPDQVIRYGDGPRQFGELRLPDGDGPFPVAVVIHGGCWLEAYDQGYMAQFAETVTEMGLATWTIGYRRIGDEGGGWPATFLDVADATDFVRQLARSQPLDPGRVVAIGHSAGAQLALWLAGRRAIEPESELYREDPLPIRAVLALAAAADLAWLSEHKTCADAATRLIGGAIDRFPRRYRTGSPDRLVPLGIPQILINGALDTTWSPPAQRYFEAARAAGDPVSLRIMPQAGHFELVDPEAAHWTVVEQGLHDLMEMLRAPR